MLPSLQSAFHPIDSVIGRDKYALLTANRIIAIKYAEVEPMYRTSWEDLLKFGSIGPAVFARAMRLAKDGALPAKQLESENSLTSFVLIFCMKQVQALAQAFHDYRPEHGFDLDLAIIVGDMFDFKSVMVNCEVFPRSEEGRMATAFASSISHRSTLKVVRDEMGGGDIAVTPVMGLLQGDGGKRGENVSDLARRITRWYQRTKGIWPVSGEFLTNYFLNRSLSSIELSGGEKVRGASVHQDFQGRASEPAFGEAQVV